MKVNIKVFGQLRDIIPCNDIIVTNLKDTNELINELNQMYPGLKAINYAIAVDKKIINENTIINEHSIIALLPPFSGG